MPLPRPGDHGLPKEGAIVVPVPAEGLTLYRLLRDETPVREDFEPMWTRPQAQLRSIPEVFRTSLSHWLEEAAAAAQSERRLAWVARLDLRPDPLTRVALTEQYGAGHVDVWAYPRDVLAAVADVVQVRKRP